MRSLLPLRWRVLLYSCYRVRIFQTATSNLVKYKFYLVAQTSWVTGGDSFRKQIGHSFQHDDHLQVDSRCLVVRLDLVDSLHRTQTPELCTDPAQAAEVMIKKLSQRRRSHSCICSLPCLFGLAHLLHGSEHENNEISRFALKNC